MIKIKRVKLVFQRETELISSIHIHLTFLYLLARTRKAKVGAISKAQNCKRGGGTLGFVKLQLVAKSEKN